jgi:hypothetical protein
MTPINAIDDGTESVGWDGKLLCRIQRWSDNPREHPLPNHSVAQVEPNVFSRYATYALQSVLISFADSNLLSSLQNETTSLILGQQRIYPEENNTYAVRHLSSGYTEIEAFAPGLELGETNLIPIQGFERGFTRWTHRSLFKAAGMTNVLLLAEYNRFSPIRGKLIQNRAVTAQISFHPTSRESSTFRPIITEKTINVLDYSSRNEILPWTKGMVDWYCQYKFTNQNWDFDSNYIYSQVAQFKTNLSLMNGYPKDMLAKANTIYAYQSSPAFQSHRTMFICFFIGFSILSAAIFRFKMQR